VHPAPAIAKLHNFHVGMVNVQLRIRPFVSWVLGPQATREK
jgi:hypothetical protein